MRFQMNDGGRGEAGFTGKIQPRDCVCRAIAIATGKDYREVYDEINTRSKAARKGSRKSRSSARNGVFKELAKELLADLGWEWVPTMKVGCIFARMSCQAVRSSARCRSTSAPSLTE